MITALYELEGEPDVVEWYPPEINEMDVYDPEKEENRQFWRESVKDKTYYKPLMWAIEKGLYRITTTSWISVESDFTFSADKWKYVDMIFTYCRTFGIDLPKVRDFPIFDDLDELDRSDEALITMYEAGLIEGVEAGVFGYYEGYTARSWFDKAITIITELKSNVIYLPCENPDS